MKTSGDYCNNSTQEGWPSLINQQCLSDGKPAGT